MGDALGVDWASLVADVQRHERASATGGARHRWRPERVLTRLGLSVHMAGRETVQQILDTNAQNEDKQPDETVTQNGSQADNAEITPPTVDSLHPVAAIQV